MSELATREPDMKCRFFLPVVIASVLAMSIQTSNAILTLTTTGPDLGTINNPHHFNFPSNPTEAQIAAALGVTVANLAPNVFKQDRDGSKYSGFLAGSYEVVYNPDNGEGTATITWVTDAWFVSPTEFIWLLAKDGKGGHYLWNLTGIWDGKEQIFIEDLWGSKYSFSHISIGGTPVPEPTTMVAGALLLLPFGASAIRMLRKKR